MRAESKKAKERAFQVMMYALSEEKRVCGMDSAEYARRYREAFEICFDVASQLDNG